MDTMEFCSRESVTFTAKDPYVNWDLLEEMAHPTLHDRVKYHLDWYKLHYPNDWVGIFLYGSQNYDLTTPASDVDTKIIVLPSFKDLIFNRKPISVTLNLPNGEHCDVKDIRLMFDCFKKQNINFLEILFTRWKIMNPEYEKLFQPIFNHREEIASYDNYAAINSMNGMIVQKHKSMRKPTPATQHLIDEYGYNGKDLCHMRRIYSFMLDRMILGHRFESCLPATGSLSEFCMAAKKQEMDLDMAISKAEDINFLSKRLHDTYLETHPRKVNEFVDDIFELVLTKIFTHKFREELK